MRVLLAACLLGWLALPIAAADAAGQRALERAADRNSARSASQLLRRMDEAMAQQSYDGVFTYMRGESVSSLRIMHTIINGVPHERLIHLDGSPREIVRIGSRIVAVLSPGDELAELTDDIPAGPFARAFVRNYARLPAQYRLVVRGTGRVAGRVAQLIGIEPVDLDRYGHQLWLDEATGMLLKSQLVGADGTPLEVFQCAQISLGRPIAAREFAAPAEPGRIPHLMTMTPPARAPAVRPRWQIGWLPRGFAMAAQTVRPPSAGAQGLQTLFFGDGLVALSVFIETLPEGTTLPDNKQIMREGATVAVSVTARDRDNRAHLVTVVGEVPPATAERVARSVTPRR